MDLNFRLPRWLSRLLLRKIEEDLERRSRVTGVASRSFTMERGPVFFEAVFTHEQDETRGRNVAGPEP